MFFKILKTLNNTYFFVMKINSFSYLNFIVVYKLFKFPGFSNFFYAKVVKLSVKWPPWLKLMQFVVLDLSKLISQLINISISI